MNIDSNTNISSMVSQSLSRLNLNNVNRSYKAGEKEEKNVKISEDELLNNEAFEKISDDKNTLTKEPKSDINVEEIQKYANLVGEELSIEDINYGIKYGRSVIAEYIA